MGVIEFFVLVFVVVCLGALCVWGMGQLAPGHPKIADNIVWFVVVLIIIVALVSATNLIGHDPQIPRLR